MPKTRCKTQYINNGYAYILSNDYDKICKKLHEYMHGIRLPCKHCLRLFKNHQSLAIHHKIIPVLLMVKINKRDCTCSGHHTKCLFMSNNVSLCGDCQHYIYNGIYCKSNRFPNNPPAILINTYCMHCKYKEPCLEVLDDYFLTYACMSKCANML